MPRRGKNWGVLTGMSFQLNLKKEERFLSSQRVEQLVPKEETDRAKRSHKGELFTWSPDSDTGTAGVEDGSGHSKLTSKDTQQVTPFTQLWGHKPQRHLFLSHPQPIYPSFHSASSAIKKPPPPAPAVSHHLAPGLAGAAVWPPGLLHYSPSCREQLSDAAKWESDCEPKASQQLPIKMKTRLSVFPVAWKALGHQPPPHIPFAPTVLRPHRTRCHLRAFAPVAP